jgi:hypothetical protein
MFDPNAFVQGYAKVMSLSWSDEGYRARILTEPKAVLAEAGIPVRDDAKVTVTELDVTGNGNIEDQIALWEKGEETGVYQLMLPRKPENMDPNDFPLTEYQLAGVTGGLEEAAAGDYCCCCCPCCCCT